jgi:glycosyltransferase involved in cell wall biosynthesis
MEPVMAEERLFLSIIVPAYNAREHIAQCLDALLASSYKRCEIIVVDDASTDDTADLARQKGATVLRTPERSGPAAARNYGASHAKGDILLFIDSDVLVTRETVSLVAKRFVDHPDIHALFGSYDVYPPENNFLSQYKNLFHHFVHQQSREEATTFWAGCGAIRKEVFQRTRFDQQRYRKPSIEDIELGHRLRRMGYKIYLDKSLQVRHRKRWTLRSLLCTDIFDRAVPWTFLILEENRIVDDLNLQPRSKASACLVGILLVTLASGIFVRESLYVSVVVFPLLLILNLDFYKFLLHKKGPGFVIPAFFVHLLYYAYSGLTFLVCWTLHRLSGKRRVRS